MRHIYGYRLRNIEDGTVILLYKNIGFPWLKTLTEAEEWVSAQETKRLDPDTTERHNTKWVFESFFYVDVKVALDGKPLVGTGLFTRLAAQPCAWERRTNSGAGYLSRQLMSLALYSGAPGSSPPQKHKRSPRSREEFLQIQNGRSPPAKLTNILTIGVYKGHAFVIKHITKLAKVHACVHCNQRFTRTNDLHRHAQTCSQGKTVIVCPGERVESPQTAFEKAFYPKPCASKTSLLWLEREAKSAGMVVRDGLRGHRWMGTTTMKQRQYSNTTAATGTDAQNVSRAIETK